MRKNLKQLVFQKTTLDSPLWLHRGQGKFERYGFPDGRQAEYDDCSLTGYGNLRNVRLEFDITAVHRGQKFEDFHAAVLFRKNGIKYLGAGLGGWNAKYSFFARSTLGFRSVPIGTKASIRFNKAYKFALEIHAGEITEFSADGESLLYAPSMSTLDYLGSTLRVGQIGLYAFRQSHARIRLKVFRMPTRAFVITNIDGNTDRRRSQLHKLIGTAGGEPVTLYDARDLSRERPLMPMIASAIKKSDFVIADLGFGEPRPNVYYELGIAHAAGIPTIHIGPNKRAFDKSGVIPSDLKSQFFILDHELRVKLRQTVHGILKAHAASAFNYTGEA